MASASSLPCSRPGLIHRYGAVRTLQGVLAATAAMLLLAAGGSVIWLGISAVVLGLGYGAAAPASTHLLVPQTPPRVFNMVMSLRQIGVPLGGVLGSLLLPPAVAPPRLARGIAGGTSRRPAACRAVADPAPKLGCRRQSDTPPARPRPARPVRAAARWANASPVRRQLLLFRYAALLHRVHDHASDHGGRLRSDHRRPGARALPDHRGGHPPDLGLDRRSLAHAGAHAGGAWVRHGGGSRRGRRVRTGVEPRRRTNGCRLRR